jgi:phosphatidylglycerophosphatase A
MNVQWSKVKGPKGYFAVLVGTALGAGLIPLAPGTWGTLIAIPLVYATADWDFAAKAALWLLLTALGTWAAKHFDQNFGSKDNQSIVMDEVVGYWLTAWFAGRNIKMIAAAFVLFRLFDIAKPPPVRQIDRWSKLKASESNSERAAWWGGFGVMADDIAAGAIGLAVMVLLQNAGVFASN